jgi:hypothetical protein
MLLQCSYFTCYCSVRYFTFSTTQCSYFNYVTAVHVKLLHIVAILHMLLHSVVMYLCYCSVVTSPVTVVYVTLPFLLHSVVTSTMLLLCMLSY